MKNTTYKISADEYSQNLASALALYSNERNASELLQMLDHQFLHCNPNSEVSLLLLQMMQNKSPDLKAELGRFFRYGIGVRENKEIAQNLYYDAMKANSRTALVNMAWSFYEDREYIKVIELLEDFLKHKEDVMDETLLEDAYSLLGDSYSRTENPDYKKCIDTLIYCAERYHSGYSYYRLSSLYMQDLKDIKDIGKSVRFLKKAADCGSATASLILAEAYAYGDEERGIEESYADAKKTVAPLMRTNNFDQIERILKIYWFSAQFGDGDGTADNYIVIDLYNKLISLYREDDPQYAREWPQIHNFAGRSYLSVQQYEKAAALLKKAYDAGLLASSDFYAFLLQEKLNQPPSVYLPIYKEHFDTYQKFSVALFPSLYLEAAYENGLYEDCLDFVAKNFDKEETKEIMLCGYVVRIILYGRVNNSNHFSTYEVVNLAEDCFEYAEKQGNAPEYEAYKILFANALGYYYNRTKSPWKAINWYLKAEACGNAEAALALGRIHERTVGTFKADSNTAYQWYVQAANLGSEAGRYEASCFKKTFLRGMVRSS